MRTYIQSKNKKKRLKIHLLLYSVASLHRMTTVVIMHIFFAKIVVSQKAN